MLGEEKVGIKLCQTQMTQSRETYKAITTYCRALETGAVVRDIVQTRDNEKTTSYRWSASYDCSKRS